MKKTTFLLIAFVFSIVTNSQTELSYNTDNVVTATNSVGCPGGDNNWARNFVLTDFPSLPASIELTSGSFGVQSSGATDEDVVVNVYTTTDINFPASYASATLVGTQTVTVATGSAEEIINYTFDTPIAIPAGTLAIIVEVRTDLGQDFFIGGTAGETTTGWLKSDDCAVTDFVTPASIGFPDANFYITITAEEPTASIDTNLASVTEIFPNPISDKLSIMIPSNIEVNSATLFDVLGKDTGIKLENNSMNTANLSAGVYFLNIKTNSGEITKKIMKK